MSRSRSLLKKGFAHFGTWRCHPGFDLRRLFNEGTNGRSDDHLPQQEAAVLPDAWRPSFALFLAFGHLQPPKWDLLARGRGTERLPVGLRLFYVGQTRVVSGNG